MNLRRLTSALVLVLGALALGCGGDESDEQPTTPDWQPSERIPVVSDHWWAEAVERPCEETADCRSDERCQLVRLSSCRSGCPEGETAEVCVPDDWQGEEALTYSPPRPD